MSTDSQRRPRLLTSRKQMVRDGDVKLFTGMKRAMVCFKAHATRKRRKQWAERKPFSKTAAEYVRPPLGSLCKSLSANHRAPFTVKTLDTLG